MDELEDSQYSSSRSSATTSSTTARQRTEKARLLKPIDRYHGGPCLRLRQASPLGHLPNPSLSTFQREEYRLGSASRPTRTVPFFRLWLNQILQQRIRCQ